MMQLKLDQYQLSNCDKRYEIKFVCSEFDNNCACL